MKLRQQPSDFRVDEVFDYPIGTHGAFAVYRLHKIGWTTQDALDVVRRHMGCARNRISYGGLKDRHAETTQVISVRGGAPDDVDLEAVRLEYLGQAETPFTSTHIIENQFRIVVRGLTVEQEQVAVQALTRIRQAGVANYFDDQRFGSYVKGEGLIAEPWIRGDYERALWLAFAAPSEFDRAPERQDRQRLRERWGAWAEVCAELRPSHRRSIVTYLRDHPTDFKGAWSRVRRDRRGLYLSALQSFLWNELLSAWLKEKCPAEQLVEFGLKTGPVVGIRSLDDNNASELRPLMLPLPSARTVIEDPGVREFVERTLSRLGWGIDELRVRFPRDCYFSKESRRAVVSPRNLDWVGEDDHLNPGRRQVTLAFALPRGSYATMLIKQLAVDT